MGARKNAWFDVRGTLPWTGGRLYFVFALGRDQRTHEDPNAPVPYERRKSSPLATIIFAITLALWALLGTAAISAVALYLVKMWAGIDLVAGSHPFPNFLKTLNLCH